METISTILPIIGLFTGTIIAYLTKEELKSGKKYFITLQHLILSLIIAILFPLKYALLTTIILLLLQYLISYKHPLITIPILAIFTQIPKTQIPIFLYLIPTGTLHYKEHKRLTIIGIAYVLISIIIKLI